MYAALPSLPQVMGSGRARAGMETLRKYVVQTIPRTTKMFFTTRFSEIYLTPDRMKVCIGLWCVCARCVQGTCIHIVATSMTVTLVYKHMHTHMHTNTYTCTCTYTHTHTHTHSTSVCTHSQSHVCVHTNTCTATSISSHSQSFTTFFPRPLMWSMPSSV